MRNATAYGASPRLRLDLVLNDFVASAHTTGRIYIKSDGTPWRPIVHIRDIIGAALAVLNASEDMCATRRSMSATQKKTTESANWPTSLPKLFPVARSNTLRMADRTRAVTE